MRRATSSRRAWTAAATLLVLFGLWYLLTTATGFIGSGRFPSPREVWLAAKQLSTGFGYADGRLLSHVLHSVRLVLLGFLVSAGSGAALGLLMGWSRRFDAFVNPVLQVIRPIPPLAWIPLAILWLGLGDAAKIFVIWFAAFVPALINSLTGVRNLDETFFAAARVHGASEWQILREVVVPGAMPMIFSGLRLSLQASWTTLVAAELVGSLAGLGHVLNVAQQDIRPDMILLAMFWVGLLGATMTWLLGRLERRVLRWHPA